MRMVEVGRAEDGVRHASVARVPHVEVATHERSIGLDETGLCGVFARWLGADELVESSRALRVCIISCPFLHGIGLGVGTLYRHFPTKEALFTAIVVTRMQAVVDDARAQLESDAPGEAFFGFVTRMFQGWTNKKDMIDALNRASAGEKLRGTKRLRTRPTR
jgi:hypothetical protein